VLRPIPHFFRPILLSRDPEYEVVFRPREQPMTQSFFIQDNLPGKTSLGIGIFDGEPICNPTCFFLTESKRANLDLQDREPLRTILKSQDIADEDKRVVNITLPKTFRTMLTCLGRRTS